MKISLNWLKEYIDLDMDVEEIAQKLTDAGIEVEEIIRRAPVLKKTVVGQIKNVKKHPDADRLSVCTVFDGSEEHQVICGAPNVAEGQLVPFAQVGSVLPNGLKIKKAKIRGVASFGMICSKEELGLEENSEGIWALENGHDIGADFNAVMAEMQDTVFDLFITPNRPDCLSHIGIAREISAFSGNEVRTPEVKLNETNEQTRDVVEVAIEDPEGCPRYCARVIRNIKIGPSPEWLAGKLEAVGLRPINNVVDVTNFVMLESGQPLHAFDLERIAGQKIIVKKAANETRFITLDDKERKLSPETVMICDAEKAVAIGGIMGGQNSEVSDETSDILLEAAYFNPRRIAESARFLQMTSDACQRFERGADPENCRRAIDRAAQLMAELGGGELTAGVVDAYPEKIQQNHVQLRPERVNRVLGTDLSGQRIESLLKNISVFPEKEGYRIPSYRVDLLAEIDLIEEVARLTGFDNIPQSKTEELNLLEPEPELERKLSLVRDSFVNLGIREVFTNSMMSARFATAGEPDGHPVKILNPISDDLSTMRQSILAGLLQVVDFNIKRKIENLKIFELGRVFNSGGTSDTLPEQPYHVALAMCGMEEEESWQDKGRPVDFFDLKAALEVFARDNDLDLAYRPINGSPVFEDTCAAEIVLNKNVIGKCGLVDKKFTNIFDINDDVFAAEIDLSFLLDKIGKEKRYSDVTRYPAVEKDFALVLDNGIAAGAVNNFIKNQGGKLLQDVQIFDLYRGEHIGSHEKSLAFRLRFQSAERTLSDDEVDKIFKRVIQKTEAKYNARLRDK